MSRLQLFWERSGSSLIHLSSYSLGKQNCQFQCPLKSVLGSWLKIKYHPAAAEAVKVPMLSFSLCPSPFDLQRRMNAPCDLASFQIKPGIAAGSWASVTGWEGHNSSGMGKDRSCLLLAVPCPQQTTWGTSTLRFMGISSESSWGPSCLLVQLFHFYLARFAEPGQCGVPRSAL